MTGKRLEAVSMRTFLLIALCSAPTVIGTGAAAWAITLGPFGIMRAYSASGILVTVILSHLIYQEHLSALQWAGLLVTVSGIVGLRLS